MDVSLVLTHDCNLGCGYCYTGAKFKKRMPRAIADRALDLAFAGGGAVQLSYFGGEPTLELGLLLDVAREARSRAARSGVSLAQSVTTNGTLLDEAKIAALYAEDLYVALSIDGVRAAHEVNRPQMGGGSSFDAAERALRLLIAAGRPFETISVVTPASAAYLGESVAWLFDAGVPRVSLNPCYEAAWDDEALGRWEAGLREAAATVKRWMRAGRTVSVASFDNKILAAIKGGLDRGDKCQVGEGFVAVSPEGHLYPCERLVGEDDRPEYRVGHVDTGVDRARVGALRPGVSEDRHAVNDECGGCAERFRCSASCACANQAETGSLETAGGVQCWHERTTAAIADALAAELMAEIDPVFLRWTYGRLGVDADRLAEKLREGVALPAPERAAAHEVSRRRTLPIVRE